MHEKDNQNNHSLLFHDSNTKAIHILHNQSFISCITFQHFISPIQIMISCADLGCYALTQEAMRTQQELEDTILSLEMRAENAEHVAEGLRLVPNMEEAEGDPYPAPKLQWVKPVE